MVVEICHGGHGSGILGCIRFDGGSGTILMSSGWVVAGPRVFARGAIDPDTVEGGVLVCSLLGQYVTSKLDSSSTSH